MVLTKYYHKNKLKVCEGLNARHIAEIFLNIDKSHLSLAECWIQKAIDANRCSGARWFLGRDHTVYADIWKRKSEPG